VKNSNAKNRFFIKMWQKHVGSTNVPSLKVTSLEILALKSEFSGGFNMKKFSIIALVLVLTVSTLAGCRKTDTNVTTVPTTTMPTSRPTVPPTTTPPTTMPSVPATEPSMDEMLPGTEDTVNPTNGANQDTVI
jgi:hypothetical protein